MILKRLYAALIIIATAVLALPAAVPCDASQTVSSPTPHYRRVGSGEDAYYEIDHYTVSSAAQLRGLASLLSPEGPVYLTCDIWLNPDENPTETEYTPIGGENRAFAGTFDGQGYTIHNLYINQPNRDSTGLFGRVSGSVSNLTVTGQVTGHTDTGGVVGYLEAGRISNVSSKVTVNGYLEAGGTVGYAGGAVIDTTNYGDVSATYGAGGVAGSSSSAMTNCVNYGNIAVTETAAGGVTSASSGTLTNCTNHGDINSTQQSGGVVGALNGTVTECVNYGTITGDFYIGGISSRIYTGGKITQCYNYGHVEAKNMAGGITGYNDEGNIDDCHNRKEIIANIMVAGIAGYNKGTITSCTSTGQITAHATEYTGGIAGENDGEIKDSYYEEGSATGTTGDQDASAGTETDSGVKDDAWFDEHYPEEDEAKKTITIMQDITVEKGETYPVPEDTTVIISGGVTVTDKGTIDNNDTIIIKDKGTLVIDTTGDITGNGVIIVEDGGKIINNSDSSVEIENGDGTVVEVKPGDTYTDGEDENTGKDTTLGQDTTIPEGETYPIGPDDTVTVPGDITLTVDGDVDNDGEIIIKDDGELVIGDTGTITGDGTITVEDGGKVVNNSDKPVTVTDQDGNTTEVTPGETHTGGEDTTDKKPDKILETDTTVPEGETYPVSPDESVVIPGDVTLTVDGTLDNDGEVTIQNGGEIHVGETGQITGGGTIVVMPGGKLTNDGEKEIIIITGDGTTETVRPGETYLDGKQQLFVMAQAETGGSITPAGKITVDPGGSITFTITANSGYEIENVAVNGIAVGALATYTMSGITESSTIQAFFKQTGDSGTYVSSGGGSGCNATHASAALAPCAALLIALIRKRKKK